MTALKQGDAKLGKSGRPVNHPPRRFTLAALNADTFYGHLQFDSTGMNSTKPMDVIEIQGGAFVTIYPTNLASKPAIWPATKP